MKSCKLTQNIPFQVTPNISNKPDDRNDLLSEIQRGKKLKSVTKQNDTSKRPSINSQNHEVGIADALRLAVLSRTPAYVQEPDMEEETYFPADEWK